MLTTKLILVIVSTSFCISRVVAIRPSGDDDYIRGNNDDNVNPFVAARQRLKQQQQMQYERAKYKYYAYNNNERRADDLNNNHNHNNNNMAYSAYMQQQQQQRLQNGIAGMAKTNMAETQSKASAKHESAVDNLQRDPDEETEKATATKKSDLSEIFRDYQHAANNNNAVKANLRGDYEVSNGESQHNAMGAQNEISKGFHQSKLEHRAAAQPTDQSATEYENDEELDLELPYGIQNVRKRMARHKPDHIKSVTYQSLCPTKRIAIPLETSGYEYRPSHYIEVTCAHYTAAHSYEIKKNRICSEAGFSCIQLNRTIHLIRRNKASTDECWESEIRIVPSGCECMWPKHDNGDIAAYHEAQKRYGAYANVQANADYEQGEGYRQIQPQQSELFGINGLRSNENPDGVGFEAFEYN